MHSLKSILIRFGERRCGIAGDIANMFFQIRIAPEDRDMLRILWFSGPGMEGDVIAFRFQVAPYGFRCIPSFAGYSLLYTAERNLPNVSSDVTERVTRDMFVDDLITGADSIEEGQRVIQEISKLMLSTGFKLTKWNASNEKILAVVAENDLAPARRDILEKNTDTEPSRKQTTLGLVWDTNTDEFFLKQPDPKTFNEQCFTKRQVVSFNNRIFDPLFWWAPLYTRMNLVCSKIVRQVKDWDDLVPPELAKEWRKAIECLDSIDLLPISRCRLLDMELIQYDNRYEFHMFADSSKDMAAAAVYLRASNGKQYQVHLVAAKTFCTLQGRSEPRINAS